MNQSAGIVPSLAQNLRRLSKSSGLFPPCASERSVRIRGRAGVASLRNLLTPSRVSRQSRRSSIMSALSDASVTACCISSMRGTQTETQTLVIGFLVIRTAGQSAASELQLLNDGLFLQ